MSNDPEYVKEFVRKLQEYERWIYKEQDATFPIGGSIGPTPQPIRKGLNGARRELIDFVSRLKT